ncbi:MAG: hypothetical protein QOF52_1436 [Propionibacteriaceae bacterium]|nr:hypothetical protein [Propionibacteriaceae bacterium]MDX6321578.1 hypothetical protein [Propionibacteriaceae bacterium]
MLIIGLTSRDRLLLTLVFGCERCGRQAAHQLVKRVRRFTVFFIPLIPISTRYLDTCTACGRVVDVPREEAERALRSGGPLRP